MDKEANEKNLRPAPEKPDETVATAHATSTDSHAKPEHEAPEGYLARRKRLAVGSFSPDDKLDAEPDATDDDASGSSTAANEDERRVTPEEDEDETKNEKGNGEEVGSKKKGGLNRILKFAGIGAAVLALAGVGIWAYILAQPAVAGELGPYKVLESEVDEEITAYRDLQGAYSDDAWKKLLGEASMDENAWRRGVINKNLLEQLLEAKCVELGIMPSDTELDQEYHIARDSYNDENWEAFLKSQGQTEEKFKEQVKVLAMREALSKHLSTDPEYTYAEDKTATANIVSAMVAEMGSGQELSTIVINEENTDAVAGAAAELASGVPFEQVKEKYNEDLTLSYSRWNLINKLPMPDVQDASHALTVGEVSAPIKYNGSVFIMKCIDELKFEDGNYWLPDETMIPDSLILEGRAAVKTGATAFAPDSYLQKEAENLGGITIFDKK